MTKIECSECHDIIDTTARLVILPYICEKCKNDAELLLAMKPSNDWGRTSRLLGEVAGQRSNAGRTARDVTEKIVGRGKSYPPTVDFPSATRVTETEAATAIIDDLTAQLKASQDNVISLIAREAATNAMAKDVSERATRVTDLALTVAAEKEAVAAELAESQASFKLISETMLALKAELAETQEWEDNWIGLVYKLVVEKESLREKFASELKTAHLENAKLSSRLDRSSGEVQNLEQLLIDARSDVESWREATERSNLRGSRWLDLYMTETGKSWWARLRGR